MANGFTIGKYLSVDSPIHRMDTALKLLVVVVYSIVLFAIPGWLNLGLCGLALVAAYTAAHIEPRYAIAGIKPVLYILVFTLVVNAFTLNATFADSTTLPLVGCFGLTLTGALTGMFYCLRIAFFIAATALITYTSTLVEIVDGTRKLLSPLARFGLPVEDIATVCALTLRFIPSTVEEAERIRQAQQARGLSLDSGGLFTRAMAWVPVIRPLFINLFRHAQTIGAAMDARCYTGATRTHLSGR